MRYLKKNWRRIAPAAMAAGMAVGVLAGCGGNDDESPDGSAAVSGAGRTVTLINESDWSDFDVQVRETGTMAGYMLPAYDRLVAVGPEGELVPYLAESWDASPTEVTFKLRTDATCADGAKVTPKVVEESFKRLITVEQLNNFLPGYFGAGPYEVSSDAAAGTFTFRTKAPYRNLAYGFANAGSVIVCPEGLKHPERLKTEMLGSGPYKLESARHGDRVVWKKREDWNWGPKGSTPAEQLPETLVYRIVGDATTAANLVTSGEVNGADLTGDGAERLRRNDALTVREYTNGIPHWINFNGIDQGPVLDRALRQAMVAAVDRGTYVKTGQQGWGTPTVGPLPPSSPCYDASIERLAGEPSLDRARKMLADGGYAVEDGKLQRDGKPVKLRFLSSIAIGAGAEYLANQWRALGIDVKSQQVEGATFARDFLAREFDVMVSVSSDRMPGAVGSRFNLFTGPPPPKGANGSGAGSGDEVVADALRTALATDGPESCQAFSTLMRRQVEQAYVGFLAFPRGAWFLNGADVAPAPSYVEPTFVKVAP